mmetsp:Transcript_12367/g.43724  ORF Transcript_12367/g.43724 Transcript_12367/m.43724 type:complete len:232 (+) Transcript_12367:1000-1695(+)
MGRRRKVRRRAPQVELDAVGALVHVREVALRLCESLLRGQGVELCGALGVGAQAAVAALVLHPKAVLRLGVAVVAPALEQAQVLDVAARQSGRAHGADTGQLGDGRARAALAQRLAAASVVGVHRVTERQRLAAGPAPLARHGDQSESALLGRAFALALVRAPVAHLALAAAVALGLAFRANVLRRRPADAHGIRQQHRRRCVNADRHAAPRRHGRGESDGAGGRACRRRA